MSFPLQIPVNQQMELLEKSAYLAMVGMSDINGAAKLSINTLKAFNLEVSDLEDVFNKLFKAQKYGKTTIKELGDSFGTVSGIASLMNVTYEETLGLLATLTQKSQDTTIASTGLRNILNQLLSPSVAIKNRLESLGFVTGKTALQGLELSEALIKLKAYLLVNNLELKDLFRNVRGVNSVSLLFNDNGEKMREIVAEMKTESLDFVKALALMKKSVGFKWGVAVASFEKTSIRFSQILKDYLIGPIERLSKELQFISIFLEKFRKASLEFSASEEKAEKTYLGQLYRYATKVSPVLGSIYKTMKLTMNLTKARSGSLSAWEEEQKASRIATYGPRRENLTPEMIEQMNMALDKIYAKGSDKAVSDAASLFSKYTREAKLALIENLKIELAEAKALKKKNDQIRAAEKLREIEKAAAKEKADSLRGYAALDNLVQNKRLSSAIQLGNYLVEIDKQVTIKKITNSLTEGFSELLAGNPLTGALKFGLLAAQIAPLLGAVKSVGGITGAFKLNRGGVIRGSMDGDRYPAMVGQGEATLDRQATNRMDMMAKDYLEGGGSSRPVELTINLNSRVIAKEVYKDTLEMQREGVLNGKNL